MRLQALELVRYGAHDARRITFGSGRLDLHLIIGPNAAGKSTMLQAIGDLLFGIGGQTTQGWRFGYDQMLIRGTIEHKGGVIEIARRKGNKNTLLRPDGSAFDTDPLAPLLGGVDRALFERMFGLNHAELRAGGQAILAGKDDAARIVLEAGAGLPQLGAVLHALEDEAADLFKPGGSKPAVNALLRTRKEALDRSRDAMLTDAAWTAVTATRTDAEAREGILRVEHRTLTERRAVIERLEAARIPLARLVEAERALSELREIPRLPLDAAQRFQAAQARRDAAQIAKSKAEERLDVIDVNAAKVTAPQAPLDAAVRIRDLAERRPVIVKAAEDKPRRETELAEIDRRLTAAKTGAKLPLDRQLPSSGWRKRARDHLKVLDNHAKELATLATDMRALTTDESSIEKARTNLTAVAEDPALRSAGALWPAGWQDRLRIAMEARRQADFSLNVELRALAPWRGDVIALRAAELPWAGQVAEAHDAVKVAENTLVAAETEAGRQRLAAADAEAGLAELADGGTVPTSGAIAAARHTRDALLDDVRGRLGGDRKADGTVVGAALAAAVVNADLLADRREAEAARIARHAQLHGTLADAGRRAKLEDESAAKARSALDEARTSWATRLFKLGFSEAVPPGDFDGWRATRSRALDAANRSEEAAREHTALTMAVERARAATTTALGSDPTRDAKATFEAAERRIAEIDADANGRARLVERSKQLDKRREMAAAQRTALTAVGERLNPLTTHLLTEVGIAADLGRIGIEDALDAAEAAAADEVKRPGLERQIGTIRTDFDTFARDVKELAIELELAADDPALVLSQRLAAELERAVSGQRAFDALAKERTERETDQRDAEKELSAAGGVINGLLKAANVVDEAALSTVLEAGARRARLETDREAAEADLLSAAPGRPRNAVAAEVNGAPSETLAAERSEIDKLLMTIGDNRQQVGAALKEAELKSRAAETSAAAADAQQDAVLLGAELASAAEDHIARTAAAAVLRWAIDRHRATNQAPLIARAGAMLAKVTGSGFRSLRVGYDTADRPVIRAVRCDGTEVGVEGLSEGTRDQLYLTLRVASLQERANLRLPLICDDVLIAADEERTGQLLTVLAEAAATTQVIVFSHHEHVVEAARRSIGADGFQLHRFECDPAFA